MKSLFYRKHFLLFILMVAMFVKMFAQDSIIKTPRPVFADASLLYDFPQSYGITAGINTPFASAIKKANANRRITTKQRDYFFAAQLGFYRYPFNHSSLFAFPSVGIRTTKNFHYHEFSVGTGIVRTIYDGRVYKVDATGNVSEVPFFGRFYATGNFSYLLGWQFKKPSLSKLSVQLKPQLWAQFPYNSFLKPHVSLEVGVRYRLRDVNIRTSVHSKKDDK